MKRAQYFRPEDDGGVTCLLCPHACRLAGGKTGICGARRNQGGELVSLNYGQVTSAALDPMEKKPLYHFYPGAAIYSLGSFGCNFKCPFCQNHTISQGRALAEEVTPGELVRAVTAQDIAFVAFTYNEPLIGYEFVLDCARELKDCGVRVVLVTNGYINQEPLEELMPCVDAMTVDLKGFSADFYRRQAGGRLEVVLANIGLIYGRCHLELTNLVVPGLNDSETEFIRLVDFVAALSPDIPLHISRCFPAYRFAAPPTPLEKLRRWRELAQEKLSFVYLGNVDDETGTETACPSCKKVLLRRRGYEVTGAVPGGRCSHCARRIYGVFEP